MEEFRSKGYWSDLTTVDHFERWAREQPDKIALVDHRVRLSFGEYFRRAKRLAAYFVQLGLTSDDVIAIQLPNWSEFAVAVNAAMLVGIPFCQFHSDFRSKEVGFILEFTKASTIVVPRTFRNFDHVAMVESLRDNAPNLKHILVVGDDIPPRIFRLATIPRRGLAAARLRRGTAGAATEGDRSACARPSPLARPATRRPCSTSTVPTIFCRRWMPS